MTVAECPCGATAIELSGEPRAQLYCHCADCRAVHGATCVPVALYLADHLKLLRGTPRRWAYRTTPRWYCADCGARLYAEPNPRLRGVVATLLDVPFNPTAHIYCGATGLVLPDGLPHFVDLPADFGGTGTLLVGGEAQG